MQQLALFGDDEVVGTGQPRPWPTAAEPEPVAENTDQLALDLNETSDATAEDAA